MSTTNTLFIMIASILVFLMTPGLAFFYGGLVDRHNVINTFMSVFLVCGLAIILWVTIGWTLSFSGDTAGIIGNLHQTMMHGVNLDHLTTGKIPTGCYAAFQMMFALITPALFVGAIVGRVRFKFLTLFIICWSVLVYYPLVHLVWGGGILAKLGTLDFAGGTVVHVNAGITALVLSVMIGPRLQNHNPEPANRSWVLLGTTLLWIGWDGFNAGSALAVNDIAMQAFLTTTIAAASAMVTWQIMEAITKDHTTLVGTCTGVLCGLVGITPACGYVSLTGALIIGISSSMISGWFINTVKPRLKIDDTLDAFGCHGIWGSIATGLFATRHVNSTVIRDGLLMGGGWKQLTIQLIATVATCMITAIITWAIIKVLGRFTPIRVSARDEGRGLDLSEHHEIIGSLANFTNAK